MVLKHMIDVNYTDSDTTQFIGKVKYDYGKI